MNKARDHIRTLFEAPENELESVRLKTDNYEMIISQVGNYTLCVMQKPPVEEVAEAPAATPRRARGVVLALSLLAGGALFAVAGPSPSPPVWKSTSVSGAPDNSSLSHFSAMKLPTWLLSLIHI